MSTDIMSGYSTVHVLNTYTHTHTVKVHMDMYIVLVHVHVQLLNSQELPCGQLMVM